MEPPAQSIKLSLSDQAILPDFKGVKYADMLNLGDREKAVLARQLFYARPSRDHEIYDVYGRCRDELFPAFVTVDVALHTFHVLFDHIFRALEIWRLEPMIKSLSNDLLSSSLSHMGSDHAAVREAALMNAAFFAVAKALLDGGIDTRISPDARTLAEAELALIEKQGGPAVSPLFGYTEDYSQFAPRGRYADHEALRRYFKALTWYGRMRFCPCKALDVRPDISRRQALQMVLILHGLKNGSYTLWKSISDPLAMLVGEPDDPGPDDYLPLYDEIYGDLSDISGLADDISLSAFIEKASRSCRPDIVSPYIEDAAEGACTTFKLLGQGYTPDSYIFHRLTFDRVGSQENPRMLPKGLDIMEVIGSKRARELLADVYGENSYANYEANKARLISWFQTMGQRAGVHSIYGSWISCLSSMFHGVHDGYPQFMKSRAWEDKRLVTALGSWVELCHDTILYRKQSLSDAMAMPPKRAEEPKGYVEPEPEIYGRLASLAAEAAEKLAYLRHDVPELFDDLAGFRDVMDALKKISEKELSCGPISDADYDYIKRAGGLLRGIASLSTDLRSMILAERDPPMPLAADVHTDATTGTALEEAIGHPYHIYVIFKAGETLTIAKGGMFSYYEFTRPVSERLADSEWRRMLEEKRAPPPPIWTKSFLLE